MEPLSKFLKVKKTSGATSERASIIEQFVEEINKERIGTKFKPIKPKVVGIKLAHLSSQDLYYFLSQCREYQARKGSFSKAFFGSLKVY